MFLKSCISASQPGAEVLTWGSFLGQPRKSQTREQSNILTSAVVKKGKKEIVGILQSNMYEHIEMCLSVV